jgi:hypothetical protein
MKRLLHGLCNYILNPCNWFVVLPRNNCIDVDFAFYFLYLCVGY